MQGDLRKKCQKCGDLIGYHFGRMIVAVVHKGNAFLLVHCRIAQGKFGRSYCVSLYADAEHLRLNTGLDLIKIKRFGQDIVNCFLVSNSRAQTVSWDILKSITGPDVHNTRLAQFFRQII